MSLRLTRPRYGHWLTRNKGFEIADPKHLDRLLAMVGNLDGVVDAYRVPSGA
ncbi:hypothetical protein GCM10029963_32770 [Micromonospora andamanensis]|uniref:hypothetical protein n=1 Tax=Micromonospora andamanensis TaxID=1287068 RepID=UPI00194DF0D8|nr:hypothetical protein [Micromonospora andamanensis]GIJ42955.1 hypothetical protein Vwe01_62800 [Micromonospora andamanensis]